jgi:DnaJ-class molecular chaperone
MNRKKAFDLLGVNSATSPEEIKKAYRRASMKHHPDRGGDAEKFKEIKEAFEFLESGGKESENIFSSGGTDFADLVKNMQRNAQAWENAFRPPNSQKVFIAQVDITLEEAFSGCVKNVALRGITGGQVLPVTIPPAVYDGECVNIFEKDEHVYRLNAKIVSEYKTVFFNPGAARQLDQIGNIEKELLVSPFKMITGGWEKVNTVDGGLIDVRIPAGMEANKLLKLKDRGYWKSNKRESRGDCFLRVVPRIQKVEDISLREWVEFKTAMDEMRSETLMKSDQGETPTE